VFYRGVWFRGPVYYRRVQGKLDFWVRGGWHADEWRGERPSGACVDRFGPPLGLDFYASRGFRIRDEWRLRWRRQRKSSAP
jgi:hypothetical protein